MSAIEYAGWQDHFLRYPHGDYYVQLLLSQIVALLANMFKKSGSRSIKLEEIAPWLFYKTPEEKAEDEKKGLLQQMQQVSVFYDMGMIQQETDENA